MLLAVEHRGWQSRRRWQDKNQVTGKVALTTCFFPFSPSIHTLHPPPHVFLPFPTDCGVPPSLTRVLITSLQSLRRCNYFPSISPPRFRCRRLHALWRFVTWPRVTMSEELYFRPWAGMSARPGKTGVCLREQSRSLSNCTREDLWTPCSTSLPPPRTKQNIGVGWGGLGGSTMSGGARAFQGAYDSIRNRPHHAWVQMCG